ncbi:MAG: hypothetical protein HDS72_03795 [Bacteroidales bacterium]|nr:hypothetical protein [Bacteroidales bacterium]
MRLLFAFIFLTISSIAVFAQARTDNENAGSDQTETVGFQISDTPAALPFDYKKTSEWKRYKLLNRLGIATSSVGGAATIFSLCLCNLYNFYGGEVDKIGIILLSVSGTVLLSSIPLFIYAGKYKKKALALNVGVSALAVPSMQGFHTSPGLTLAFSF